MGVLATGVQALAPRGSHHDSAPQKALKQLFADARRTKPCVVFIDEIDSIGRERQEGENESARRLKTELLRQLDGVGTDNQGVTFIAATNVRGRCRQRQGGCCCCCKGAVLTRMVLVPSMPPDTVGTGPSPATTVRPDGVSTAPRRPYSRACAQNSPGW